MQQSPTLVVAVRISKQVVQNCQYETSVAFKMHTHLTTLLNKF